MSKDAPLLLQKELGWFASIIGRPIDEDSKMNPISPSGNPMEIEATEHIAPSPTLRPAQRIQIYNQQYWWRLLNTLHDIFPTVTRLFGYYDFNRTIGIPYLTKYPPNSWSLNTLGYRLAQWLEEEYHAKDRQLVIDASKIDWAFSECFLAKQLPHLTLDSLPDEDAVQKALENPLYAQPHINLFTMPYHLFDFRRDFLLNDPDYWVENDFPKIKRETTYHFILYRNSLNDISWKEISEGEYHLLNFFKNGMTLESACEWLEKQNGDLYDSAMENLQNWFKEWTERRWLSLHDPKQYILTEA